MAECVAKIELATLAVFKLVSRHHAGLHPGGRGDKRCHLPEPCGENLRPALLVVAQSRSTFARRDEVIGQALEQSDRRCIMSVILDDERLEHLCRTSLEHLHRQTLKHLRADICKYRLANSAKHILIASEIDAGLASDRRIHLRQKGCRHICKAHSPLIYRSRETYHIGSDTAADSEHKRIPVSAVLQQPSADIHHGLHAFCLLRHLHQHSWHAVTVHHLRHLIRRRTRHRHIRIHHHKHMLIRFQTSLQHLHPILNIDLADHLFAVIYIYLLHRSSIIFYKYNKSLAKHLGRIWG